MVSVQAQNTSNQCKYRWKWVWVWEWEYNGATARTEYQYVYRYRYVYDCLPEPMEILIDSLTPKGDIQKIWVDYNTRNKEILGMRIHLTFDVSNLKDSKCSATAYFYYASGDPLKDLNRKFRTTNGNVAVHDDFKPPYVNAVYKDFQLFMPYDELHMATGKSNLKFDAKLWCPGVGFLASKEYLFDYSRPK
jgi:hypothetical protein